MIKIDNTQLGCAIHAILKDEFKLPIDEYGTIVSKLLVYLIADNPNGYVNFHENGLSIHQETK